MDYSKVIKSRLESQDFVKTLEGLDEFNYDKEAFLKQLASNANILCSNNSFLFIYFEQAASFFALSLNRLCKSIDEKPIGKYIQVLFFKQNI